MRVHWHTDPAQLAITTLGVLIVIHTMRIAAVQLAAHSRTSFLAKPIAAFALVG